MLPTISDAAIGAYGRRSPNVDAAVDSGTPLRGAAGVPQKGWRFVEPDHEALQILDNVEAVCVYCCLKHISYCFTVQHDECPGRRLIVGGVCADKMGCTDRAILELKARFAYRSWPDNSDKPKWKLLPDGVSFTRPVKLRCNVEISPNDAGWTYRLTRRGKVLEQGGTYAKREHAAMVAFGQSFLLPLESRKARSSDSSKPVERAWF